MKPKTIRSTFLRTGARALFYLNLRGHGYLATLNTLFLLIIVQVALLFPAALSSALWLQHLRQYLLYGSISFAVALILLMLPSLKWNYEALRVRLSTQP